MHATGEERRKKKKKKKMREKGLQQDDSVVVDRIGSISGNSDYQIFKASELPDA